MCIDDFRTKNLYMKKGHSPLSKFSYLSHWAAVNPQIVILFW